MARGVFGIPLREVWGFLVVGVFGIIADIGTFNIGVVMGMSPLAASLLGFILGVIVSFTGNRLLTFRDRAVSHMGRAWITFTIINVVAVAGIQLAVWAGAAAALTLVQLNVVRTAAIALATLFRFVAYRRWVFFEPVDEAGGGAPR